MSAETRKSNHDIRREVFLDFKELTIINDQTDDFFNIVGLIGRFRDDAIKRIFPFAAGCLRFERKADLPYCFAEDS